MSIQLDKLPPIATLRQRGFKVRVIYRRLYKYLEGGKVKKIFASSKQILEKLTPKEARNGLQNHRGEVRVEVRTPNDREIWGESFCHKDDTFNRKSGRDEALFRALEQATPEDLAFLE